VEQRQKEAQKKRLVSAAADPSSEGLAAPNLVVAQQPKELVAEQELVAEKYELLALLGKGGMGSVYKARHRELGKIVAIKILESNWEQNFMSYERFMREAKASSRLSHPNVISVYDFGFLPGQRPFIVMDYLEGNTLADLLKEKGRLPPERAEYIFRQICAGLAHAHNYGIIHRDLKPSNVMLLEKEGDSELVKILDFGIAKVLPNCFDTQS